MKNNTDRLPGEFETQEPWGGMAVGFFYWAVIITILMAFGGSLLYAVVRFVKYAWEN